MGFNKISSSGSCPFPMSADIPTLESHCLESPLKPWDKFLSMCREMLTSTQVVSVTCSHISVLVYMSISLIAELFY